MSADAPLPPPPPAAPPPAAPPPAAPPPAAPPPAAPPPAGPRPAARPLAHLEGWGRHPTVRAPLAAPRTPDEAASLVRAAAVPLAPRGAGRAYGDAALPLPQGLALSTRRLDRFVAVDEAAPALTAESGVLLHDIQTALLPRGLFPPVVPGTRFVTLGGMIAADVHGKNHHAPDGGVFSDHLDWVEVLDGAGRLRRLAPGDPGFAETCGGMGLTGLILRARLRLRRVETGWLRQETVPAPSLDAAMDALDASRGWSHASAWIDCLAAGPALGRALIYRAEHAALSDLTFRERPDRWALKPATRRAGPPPDLFPGFALNRLSVRAFNALHWSRGLRAARRGPALVDWPACFHPLDALLGWNRIYGRRGFVQFQCALPRETARHGLRAMLEATSASGQGSFLAVLKALGPARPDPAALSFPLEGWTLALDFPAAPRALALVDRLHAIARAHAGRIYLAKDARLAPDDFAAMEPRAPAFRASAARDPAFATAQSRRLSL